MLHERFAVTQLTDVRDLLGSLQRETKVWWRFREPIFQRRFTRDATERVIDFRGVKSLTVERQHFLRRKFFRIKTALPFRILKPRCANPKHRSSLTRFCATCRYSITRRNGEVIAASCAVIRRTRNRSEEHTSELQSRFGIS